MAPSSMNNDDQRMIESCIQLMKGPSDESRFAGLLMMAKHLSTASVNQELLGNVRKQVLEAVKPEFLGRLLQTPSPPHQQEEGSSSSNKDDDQALTSFQGVALAIISCLVQDPSLVTPLRPLLRSVLSVLDKTQDDGLIEDCLFYLYSLGLHDDTVSAAEALAKNHAFSRLASCLMRLRRRSTAIAAQEEGREKKDVDTAAVTQQDKKQEAKKKEEKGEVGEEGEDKDKKASSSSSSSSSSSLMEQACATLQQFATLEEATTDGDGGGSGSRCWIVDDSQGFILLAEMLDEERTELKFHLLRIMSTLLSQRRGKHGWGKEQMGDLSYTNFGEKMRSSLIQLLHGGLKEMHRDHALSILVHMLGIFGQSWAIEEGAEGEGKASSRERQRGSSVCFFVNALAAEARMAAEELEALWGAEDLLAAEPHLHQRIERAQKVLPLCLDGMDTVLRFLCGVGDGEYTLSGPSYTWYDDLSSDMVLKIRTSLQDIAGPLVRILKDAAIDLRRGDDDICPTFQEAINFLSAVIAEDDTIVSPQDAILALPTVIHLVLGPGGASIKVDRSSSSGGGGGGGRRGHLLYPWISLILSQEGDEDEDEVGGGTGCVMTLVDHHMHHFLINQLANDAKAATADNDDDEIGHPLHIKGEILLLHDMMKRGGNVACDEHQAFISHHPEVLALLPRLALCLGSGKIDTSSSAYIIWFIMSTMQSSSSSFAEDEIDKLWSSPNSQEYRMLMEGLAQVLVRGMDRYEVDEDQEGDEEEEEEATIWKRILEVTRLSSSSSLRMSLFKTTEQLYGRRKAEGLSHLLIQQS